MAVSSSFGPTTQRIRNYFQIPLFFKGVRRGGRCAWDPPVPRGPGAGSKVRVEATSALPGRPPGPSARRAPRPRPHYVVSHRTKPGRCVRRNSRCVLCNTHRNGAGRGGAGAPEWCVAGAQRGTGPCGYAATRAPVVASAQRPVASVPHRPVGTGIATRADLVKTGTPRAATLRKCDVGIAIAPRSVR